MTKQEIADAITQAIREDWQGGRVQELVAQIYGEQNEKEVAIEDAPETGEETLSGVTGDAPPKRRGRARKPVAEQ